ncbi:hypothetical protein TIFTF001_035504 [Ficus carica]|uniref:Uncharacterized protein n=1 Tax=Ficus carica TaxID=3494 RepID=A0AA88E2E1_FICCA|nr:hypothetical protein TIFTF001_035504 [Ficus carica]
MEVRSIAPMTRSRDLITGETSDRVSQRPLQLCYWRNVAIKIRDGHCNLIA